MEYRRRQNSDTWHFEPTCSWWPLETDDYIYRETEKYARPGTGELCDECKAIEKQDA